MAQVYCLAYPKLDDTDRVWIEAFRAQNDVPYAKIVPAHVTLMFAMDPARMPAAQDHIAMVAAQTPAISFHCRYAMLGRDHAAPVFHVFLVPDDGNSAISRLHDHLYSGPFADLMRLDIPYIPHITLGTLDQAQKAKDLCDTLNATRLSVRGEVTEITLATLEADQLTDSCRFSLTG